MENYEIYNDLINGKLDDTSAKDLFSRLALDDEKRLEFNSYVSLTENLKNNLDSFKPGAKLRNRIYANAGVNVQLLDNQLLNEPAFKTGFWGSKLFTGISSGLVSGIIVYLLMQFVGFPLYMNNFANSNIPKSINPKNNVPVSDSRESFTMDLKSQKPIIKYIYIYRDKDKITAEAKNSEKNLSQNNALIEISNLDNHYPIFNNSLNKSDMSDKIYSSINNQNVINKLLDIDSQTGLSFEFGSSVNWNFPQETLYPSEISKFNSLAFTVFYDLNDFIKIGANIKQETFFTQYSGTEDIGSTYNYRQNPNLTTYSAVVRTFTAGFDIFKPYFQGSFGANESGFVLRPQLGVEIQPNDNVSVNFGIDYSYFRFIHQNSWFTADKVGINYGISYKF